jgi:hypothetical protein
LGKNRKSKRRVPYVGRSHVVKTDQERSEYDDLVRTAPTTNPTDEIRVNSLEKPEVEFVESPHVVHAGVEERRTRIQTKSSKIPWGTIASIVMIIGVACTIVAFYVRLDSKVSQIDSLVIESKTNTDKMREVLESFRERLVQLEVKLDNAGLTDGKFSQYSREIESLKEAVADTQAQNKDTIRQIEQRIEQLEMEIYGEKKKTRR